MVEVGVNEHMRHDVVCPKPISFSLIRCDLTAKALIGPMAPHTMICGVQNTLKVPLNFISKAPVFGSLANIFANDCLKVSARNCSARIMFPPV